MKFINLLESIEESLNIGVYYILNRKWYRITKYRKCDTEQAGYSACLKSQFYISLSVPSGNSRRMKNLVGKLIFVYSVVKCLNISAYYIS